MPYPSDLPASIPFHHKGTVSSNGKSTTTGANEEIDFSATPLNSLQFTAHDSDITIKLNDESNYHLIETGSSMVFNKMLIEKITILESGVLYSYSGAYYKS